MGGPVDSVGEGVLARIAAGRRGRCHDSHPGNLDNEDGEKEVDEERF